MQKINAIFLDRDGTVIVDKNYLKDPNQLEWMPMAVEGLKLLREKGYLLFLVTNQSGIGRGMFTEKDLRLVHNELNLMMKNQGLGEFNGIAYCPHQPSDECPCRKPKSLMINKFVKLFDIDTKKSWMLGDKDIDALCGKNAGVKSAIIGNHSLKKWAAENNCQYFENLWDFANSL